MRALETETACFGSDRVFAWQVLSRLLAQSEDNEEDGNGLRKSAAAHVHSVTLSVRKGEVSSFSGKNYLEIYWPSRLEHRYPEITVDYCIQVYNQTLLAEIRPDQEFTIDIDVEPGKPLKNDDRPIIWHSAPPPQPPWLALQNHLDAKWAIRYLPSRNGLRASGFVLRIVAAPGDAPVFRERNSEDAARAADELVTEQLAEGWFRVCASCGTNWSAGLWNWSCNECDAGSLHRPCDQCLGSCGTSLIRSRLEGLKFASRFIGSCSASVSSQKKWTDRWNKLRAFLRDAPAEHISTLLQQLPEWANDERWRLEPNGPFALAQLRDQLSAEGLFVGSRIIARALALTTNSQSPGLYVVRE